MIFSIKAAVLESLLARAWALWAARFERAFAFSDLWSLKAFKPKVIIIKPSHHIFIVKSKQNLFVFPLNTDKDPASAFVPRVINTFARRMNWEKGILIIKGNLGAN